MFIDRQALSAVKDVKSLFCSVKMSDATKHKATELGMWIQ